MMSYQGSDDEEELKLVPTFNNSNINVISDSDNDEDIKNNNKNVFDEHIDTTPQTTIKVH